LHQDIADELSRVSCYKNEDNNVKIEKKDEK
jgi:hypothetical protein